MDHVVDRPADVAYAWSRSRPEDVYIDPKIGYVFICDVCDDQPLTKCVFTKDKHLCLRCAEAAKAPTSAQHAAQ